MNGPGDFERELERELHRVLDPIAAAPIPPRRATAPGGFGRRLVGGAGAALGLKVLTGFAVVAFAGAATEAAVTRSLNPAAWGQQVHQTVQTCKDQLRGSGTSGIGECVSAFATQHSPAASVTQKSPETGTKADGKDKGTRAGSGGGATTGSGTGGGADTTGSGGGNGGDGNGSGPDQDNGKGGGHGDKHPGPPPVPAT